jgi:hypothetical protein
MIETLILIWLLCVVPAYMILREYKNYVTSGDGPWHRPEPNTWTHGDRIFSVVFSVLLGPFVVLVCIWGHIPWKAFSQPICDWLEKPVRW